MKKYFPSYYNNFSCIAGECPDSCCRKWEIVIDNETLRRYQSLDTPFGEKIRSEIIRDEEGDCCFRLNNGNCPFLNERRLCDIHIELGEAYTSEICRNHPRFIEEYDGFSEISLSLSCPEANRIILSDNKALYPAPEYHGDDEVLSLLIASREKLLSANESFLSSVSLLLDTAADDSLDIDLVYIENHPELNISFLKFLGKFLAEKSEILTDEWRSYLNNVSSGLIIDDDFITFLNRNDKALCLILKYYIYRYYLKAVNDLDIYSRALFIASQCLLSALIALNEDISVAEASRLCSKEIEHNLFNIDLLLEFFSGF